MCNTTSCGATPTLGRRRRSNRKDNRRLVTTRRSIDWKLVYSLFELLHARFTSTMEGCADNDDLNSHGNLPQCSPRDFVLERIDLTGERVFFNLPWEFAELIAHHFETSCRRRAPTSTMAMFVLPKKAKVNDLHTVSRISC
jgi:hypothetical protein